MKKRIIKFFQIILRVSVLGGFLVILYFVFKYFWVTFSSLDAKLSAGLATAVAAIIGSLISVLWAKRIEHKENINNQHREKKIPVYEELIEFLFKIMMAHKLEEELPSEKDIIEFMSQFTQKLIIWGSDDIVIAFSKFRGVLIDNNPEEDSILIVFYVEELLLAIRKDLGHKNKDLAKGTLLKLFVNDMDKHLSNT